MSELGTLENSDMDCGLDCNLDAYEWVTARGEMHGLPAKMEIPVCETHFRAFQNSNEPLQFHKV